MQDAAPAIEKKNLEFDLSGTRVRLVYLRRPGALAPLLCLHGFGSTKEDYADMALHPAFDGRELVFLDAPGCGQSKCDNAGAVSIPFLRDVVKLAIDRLGLGKFHLLGHSMGGLTALLLAIDNPDRVLSFANIEGNISPEDCFLSRQIYSHPADSAREFLGAFIARNGCREEWSLRLFAAALPGKISADMVGPIFRSMVDLSDTAPLMDMFTGLRCPKMFVYGDQNSGLSYLGGLPEQGVELAEIPHSAHFPMYSNPVALWSCLADFVARCDPAG